MRIVIEIPDIVTAMPGRDPVTSPDFVALHNIRAGLTQASTMTRDIKSLAVVEATHKEMMDIISRPVFGGTLPSDFGAPDSLLGIRLKLVEEVPE